MDHTVWSYSPAQAAWVHTEGGTKEFQGCRLITQLLYEAFYVSHVHPGGAQYFML